MLTISPMLLKCLGEGFQSVWVGRDSFLELLKCLGDGREIFERLLKCLGGGRDSFGRPRELPVMEEATDQRWSSDGVACDGLAMD